MATAYPQESSDHQALINQCVYSQRLLDKIISLNNINKSQIDLSIIRKAIFYAIKFHAEQKRASGEPFYSHPLEVAYIISDYVFNTEIIATCILHDILEDTEVTEQLLLLEFGEKITDQVKDLTRVQKNGDKVSSAEMIESLWQQQKYEVLLVKMIDRLHNMRTIGAKSPEKIKKTVQETLKHFLALSEVMELPQIADYLYQECFNANLKLGLVKESENIFDKQFKLE